MASSYIWWPLVLVSLIQFLHLSLAVEITYPNVETIYSEPPYDIEWIITSVESHDLEKINIYLTSYKVPTTALAQILWATVDANSSRVQIGAQPKRGSQGDRWKLTFHDASSDFFDGPIAHSAEFSFKGASISAQLPSMVDLVPSVSLNLAVPSTTSPTETQTTTTIGTSSSHAEPTHSTIPDSAAIKNGTSIPHSTALHDETAPPGLSVGVTTGIGVGMTCVLFGLCAAVCHIKANRRRAAKAKAAATLEPEGDVYEYEVGKAVSVDISRHVSVGGGASTAGQGGKGKRSVQLQRCPTVRMGTGQKLSSETPR